MGKIVEKSKKRKKKGRPSLLDLQIRSLKHHHPSILTATPILNSTPTSSSSAAVRRSTRRNPNPSSSISDDDHHLPARKKHKKLHLVGNLDDQDEEDAADAGLSSAQESDNDSTPQGYAGRSLRKRKIHSISPGSAAPIQDDKLQVEKLSTAATTQTNTLQGSKQDDGPTTPLPDKKLLLFILDRLQKKDTYGVFAEPVDPEELPDYFEVIEHPMDFGTVRKKLDDAEYGSLDQFEKDVFLICSNAMQYNAPDTIYFRQARSILELAKKNFENLRQDSDDNEQDPEPKVVRRGRPPTKHLKRPPGRPPVDRANSDFAEATLVTPPRTINRLNNELRKGSSPLEKHGSADSFGQSLYGSRSSDAYIGWSAERFERSDDFTGSSSKGISMRLGRKQIVLDEKRNTYKHPYALAYGNEPSVLTTFDGERKQLIAVGLHTEHGYARSLARFAAKLGPVAWKVASRRIENCLPSGVKFGPGWVVEDETPAERPLQQLPDTSDQASAPPSMPGSADLSSAPIQSLVESIVDRSEQKPQEEQVSAMQVPTVHPKLENEPVSPPAAFHDSAPASSANLPSNGAGASGTTPEATANICSRSNMSSTCTGPVRSENSIQIHNQTSTNQSHVNGLNGSYGLNFAAQMGKMIGAGRPTMFNFHSNPSIAMVSSAESQSVSPPSADNNGSGGAKVAANSSTTRDVECSPNTGPHQKVGSNPRDLTVGFQSPGSRGSGKADLVQPDLALQL